MFDIGFLELLLIGIISLIVLGPERLPKAARTVGIWVGKAKKGLNSIKHEIDRELKVQELREQLEEQKLKLQEQAGLSSLKDSLSEVQEVMSDTQKTLSETKTALSGTENSSAEPQDSQSEISSIHQPLPNTIGDFSDEKANSTDNHLIEEKDSKKRND